MLQLSYLIAKANKKPEFKTMPDHLKYQAEKQPDEEAFIFYSADGQRDSITFSELYCLSQKFASALISLGTKKGDRIMLCLGNTLEWLVVVMGLMNIGAIPVFVLFRSTDASDLHFVLQRCNADGLIFASDHPSILSGIKRLKAVHSASLKHIISINLDAENDDLFVSYKRLMTSSKANSFSSRERTSLCLAPDDIAIIMRSSGTADRPKLIAHTHMNINNYFCLSNPDYSQLIGRKLFSNEAFSWLAGSPFADIINGRTRVTYSGKCGPKQMSLLLKYTILEDCSFALYTRDILNTIIRNKISIPSCLRVLVHVGSRVKKEFSHFYNDIQCMNLVYGCLETGGIASILVKKGMEMEDGIAGYPISGVEIKIVGENNETTQLGKRGRIFARHSDMFLGYVGDDEMTKNSVTTSGWYNTCDTGYISENRRLYILGRDGESIQRFGATIPISLLESSYECLHIPYIENLIVVPVPSEITNEEICVCVIFKQGYSLTNDELKNKFHEKINVDAGKPKYVVSMESFPTNANGKVDRNLIKKLMAEQMLSDQET